MSVVSTSRRPVSDRKELTGRATETYPGLSDRVNYWLTEWARWMRRPEQKLGYPKRTLGLVGGGESQRWDDWAWEGESEAWERNCRAIDALIQDLPVAQNCAIQHLYLGTVWRFPRDNASELLNRAEAELLRGMNARAIL